MKHCHGTLRILYWVASISACFLNLWIFKRDYRYFLKETQLGENI